MSMNFRSVFEVTHDQWLTGLAIGEDELTAGWRFIDPMVPQVLTKLDNSNQKAFAAALALTEEVI